MTPESQRCRESPARAGWVDAARPPGAGHAMAGTGRRGRLRDTGLPPARGGQLAPPTACRVAAGSPSFRAADSSWMKGSRVRHPERVVCPSTRELVARKHASVRLANSGRCVKAGGVLAGRSLPPASPPVCPPSLQTGPQFKRSTWPPGTGAAFPRS